MTAQDLQNGLRVLRHSLDGISTSPPLRASTTVWVDPRDNQPIDVYAHLKWMCDEALSWDLHVRKEKAMRWLGFIQAGLWATGHATIQELKQINRTTEDA